MEDPADEQYKSSEDEDFRPDEQSPPHSESSSSEEDEAGDGQGPRPKKKRKLKAAETVEDLDLANSGDEAIVRRGAKKRKKKTKGGVDEDEEDEGGEGGLIKTRAQRAKEGKEKKPLASTKNATVDVDALWQQMLNDDQPKVPARPSQPEDSAEKQDATAVTRHEDASPLPSDSSKPPAAEEDMITIKRTYDFAGETITERKQVPKSSAEARLFLQSQVPTSSAPTNKPPLRRPKKRTSMFEPNPTGAVAGLKAPVSSAPKLNTVEKSKMDWAGFVDKEGIAEELDEHSRAKEGYLGRMDFLGRVEANKEEELKKAKQK